MSVKNYSPDDFLRIIRGHWSIENCLHHRKDRSFDEDRNRASRKGIAQPMCFLRSIAALMLGKSSETLAVIQRRLTSKPHLLLKMLLSNSAASWIKQHQPFKVKVK